jgi:hypothetical protein
MQEAYGEDRASHTDPESCTLAGEGGREALTGACAGGLWSRAITRVRGADGVAPHGRLHLLPHHGQRSGDLARSKNLRMHSNTARENRELPWSPVTDGMAGRIGTSQAGVSCDSSRND